MYISRTTTLAKSCKPLINNNNSSPNNSLFSDSRDYFQKTSSKEISFGQKSERIVTKGIFAALSSLLFYSTTLKKIKPIVESCKVQNISQSKKNLIAFFKSIPLEDFQGETPKANMHIHSIFSDGTASVQQIVEQAIKKRKKVISITDHNTTEHLKEIEKYRQIAEENNLKIINGTELTVDYNNTKLHLLIFGADDKDAELNKFCDEAKKGAKLPAKEIVETLSKSYVIDLAHPIVYNKPNLHDLIKDLKNSGLDGVEVFYPYKKLDKMLERNGKSPANNIFKNIAVLREKIVNPKKIAKNFGLLMTGGKDSHSLDIDVP